MIDGGLYKTKSGQLLHGSGREPATPATASEQGEIDEAVQFILNVCNVKNPDKVINYDPLTQRERVREIIKSLQPRDCGEDKAMLEFLMSKGYVAFFVSDTTDLTAARNKIRAAMKSQT